MKKNDNDWIIEYWNQDGISVASFVQLKGISFETANEAESFAKDYAEKNKVLVQIKRFFGKIENIK